MARFIPHLICYIFLLPFSVDAQQTNGSVSVGASLAAGADAEPWLSRSGDFAFGFQQVEGEDRFLLSIWYDKIPDKTIVWCPKDGPTAPRGSKVDLTVRGLMLSDPHGRELWASESLSDPVAYGVMNDTGDLMLVRDDSVRLWQSFDVPTDTVLPGQVMVRGQFLFSKTSRANFSRGRFELRMLPDGNLVLNVRDVASGLAYDAYYVSGTRGSSNSSDSGDRVVFDETGYMYISRENGERFKLTPSGVIPSGDYYHRATLDFDGVFAQYYHPKSSDGNASWSVVWLQPENICVAIRGSDGSGACGFNSVCTLGDGQRPSCECPVGFALVDPGDRNGDCKSNFTQSCDEDRSSNGGLVELVDTDWPYSDYAHMQPATERNCMDSCLSDCFCAVAIHRGDECWKKKMPLSNGQKDPSVGGKAFLKLQKGNLPSLSGKKNDRKRKRLIVVGSALFGSSLFVIVVLIGVICRGYLIDRKTRRNLNPVTNVVENALLRCTYQELVEATNGFTNELGKGAFGVVYKGVLGSNVVAVKRLGRALHDSEKEFRTEVNTIARTHHKNLVQLLGFCHDGDHRLLVYEYMRNGTLASFLFGHPRPSWEQRSSVALDVAKGLSYLHEECAAPIIHCDVKPQNILLDDYHNARISDFGIAKLLMTNQSGTSTGIRGTKGYIAPEWFRNAPVTIKVDVYSFGVVLLEIVSCRTSLGDGAVLTDWAWDCYEDRNLGEFVDHDFEALDDIKKLEVLVMVSLWCVQEDPGRRPAMSTVVQMLQGVVEVTAPPCPSPFSVGSS